MHARSFGWFGWCCRQQFNLWLRGGFFSISFPYKRRNLIWDWIHLGGLADEREGGTNGQRLEPCNRHGIAHMCLIYPDACPSRLSSSSRRSRGKWSRHHMMVIGEWTLPIDVNLLLMHYSIPPLGSTSPPVHLAFRLAPSHPLSLFVYLN